MMSAIAGVINLTLEQEAKDRLFDSMRRRGPYGTHSVQASDVVLLYAEGRSKENVPTGFAQIRWMGRSYSIIFDGAIYNRRELVKELKTDDALSDMSDGMLMLQAFLQWGPQALERCNGVFALAIWCHEERKLFLARDRIGVKPLFWMEHGGGFLFSSEMKTILTYPGVEACLDTEGVAALVLLGPGRIPESGVFAGIRALEPGCWGEFADGKFQQVQYWRLKDRLHRESFEETAEIVRSLLQDSVKRQMDGVEEIGAMLSGGLDSSLISAVAAHNLASEGKRLNSFSLDYRDSEKHFVPGYFQPDRDTDYIHLMQQSLDTTHHWTVLSPDDLVALIADATVARDLPGMADVDMSLMAFCGDIRKKADVVLSGECADEIFGGYPWYRDEQLRNYDGFPWAQTTAERSAFLHPSLRQKIDPIDFVQSHYRQALKKADILQENDPENRRIKELTHLNFYWFMQTLLDRSDRMAAWHGLEIRVPFCDYRIAEYLYGVPWHMKNHGGQEKGLLRHAMRQWLPEKVLWRKKSPFPKTYDPEYLSIVSQLLRALLEDSAAPIYGIAEKSALQQLLDQDYPWPWYGQLMRRPQTIVYMLQINYWLEHYSVRFI